MKSKRYCTLFLTVLAGCSDTSYFPGQRDALAVDSRRQPGEADAGPRSDVFIYKCEDVVDVLFVLDVSSSMEFVLDTLGKEIGVVVDAANKLQPDSHFGFIGYVDNHRLDATGPLEAGKVHTGAATLQKAFASFKQLYTVANRNPGDGPTGPTLQNPICEENAPDALHAAATEFPWRSSATRVIILATDDTFLEPPDNYGDRDGDGKTDKTDYPREGDYPARFGLAQSAAALKAAKVRVFSFTRLAPPFFPSCGTGRRLPPTAVSNGWSTPYNGQKPFGEQTSGKNFDLDAVFQGKLSLAETIKNVVIESHCKPIE